MSYVFPPRVPETKQELDDVERTEPTGWEYWLYAGQLNLAAIEVKPEADALASGGVSTSGEALGPLESWNMLSRVPSLLDEALEAADSALNPELQVRAFGGPGESGDVTAIKQLANALGDVYRTVVGAGRTIQSATFDPAFRPAQETTLKLFASVGDGIRNYALDWVAVINRLPGMLESGDTEDMNIALTVEFDPGLTATLLQQVTVAAASHGVSAEDTAQTGDVDPRFDFTFD